MEGKAEAKAKGKAGAWLPAVENGSFDCCLEDDLFDLTYASLSQLKLNSDWETKDWRTIINKEQ